MKRILDPAQRPLLARFARRDTLMAFDYDGTLAPIAARPSQARMRPRTRELLAEVARRYATIVITGRARSDVLQFLEGVALLEVIGNHGYETFGAPPASVRRRVAAWRDDLAGRLGAVPGVVVEDKRYSLAIHYRACSDPASASRAIRSAAAALAGARLTGGKAVVNIVPEGAPDKGVALLRTCRRLGCPRALFVGDDDTDEDVFRLDDPDKVLGIRVGAGRGSAAAYALRSQEEIDDFLAVLAHPPPAAGGA